MAKRILTAAAAIALAAGLTVSVADAKPRHKSKSSSSSPNFVDMNDDGVYTKKQDIEIKKLGGGIKLRDHNRVVTGSAVGCTFLVVANGHDLYLNKDVAGSNLVIVVRGGDIHVAPGAHIQASGNTFGIGTRDLKGDKSEGSVDFGEGSSVSHVYSGPGRQVQIEAADMTVGANVSISSMTQAAAKARSRSTAAPETSPSAYVKGTNSLSIDSSATIEGLMVIGPKG